MHLDLSRLQKSLVFTARGSDIQPIYETCFFYIKWIMTVDPNKGQSFGELTLNMTSI